MLRIPRKKNKEIKKLEPEDKLTPYKEKKKRGKHKSSFVEALERRREAFKMRLQGANYREIAERLDVGYMTVKRDLDIFKEELNKRITQFDKNYALGKTLSVYEQIEKEAWEQFHSSNFTASRIQCLNLIRTTRNDQTKLLMDIGLIGKAPTKVEHKVETSAATALQGWTKEAQNLVALAIIRSQLPTPAEPIPDKDKIIDISPTNPETLLLEEPLQEEEINEQSA